MNSSSRQPSFLGPGRPAYPALHQLVRAGTPDGNAMLAAVMQFTVPGFREREPCYLIEANGLPLVTSTIYRARLIGVREGTAGALPLFATSVACCTDTTGGGGLGCCAGLGLCVSIGSATLPCISGSYVIFGMSNIGGLDPFVLLCDPPFEGTNFATVSCEVDPETGQFGYFLSIELNGVGVTHPIPAFAVACCATTIAETQPAITLSWSDVTVPGVATLDFSVSTAPCSSHDQIDPTTVSVGQPCCGRANIWPLLLHLTIGAAGLPACTALPGGTYPLTYQNYYPDDPAVDLPRLWLGQAGVFKFFLFCDPDLVNGGWKLLATNGCDNLPLEFVSADCDTNTIVFSGTLLTTPGDETTNGWGCPGPNPIAMTATVTL